MLHSQKQQLLQSTMILHSLSFLQMSKTKLQGG